MAIVVLLARQRSGTNALGRALDTHSQFAYLNEVFHDGPARVGEPETPLTKFNFFNFCRTPAGLQLSHPLDSAERFVAYIEYINKASAKNYSVLDVKYNSIFNVVAPWLGPVETPTLFTLLAKSNVPIVWLTRRNLLKTFVSFRTAELSGNIHRTKDTEETNATIYVDLAELRSFITQKTEEDARIASFVADYDPILCLEYDHLFQSDGVLAPGSSAALERFLNVDELHGISTPLRKLNTRPLREIIENYHEVEQLITRTSNAWMLDDG